MAIMAKTTPVIMIPILAPDVILTFVSSKRSGRVSMADGRGQKKRDQGQKKPLEYGGGDVL